ncbi:MAG TPA: hypothetical protein VF041_20565 [Gemmatimonadaceae bacterium]
MKYIGLLCAAFAIAACNKKTGNTVSETAGGGVAPAAAGTDTMGTSGTTGAAGTDTTTMPSSSDTTGAATGARSDSMRADSGRTHDSTGASSDTAQNQTQSGMTNAKKGKSTLGPRVKKTTPTSGAPVTSKGDTLRQGGDTSSHPY